MHIFILNLVGEEITMLCKYRNKHRTVNGVIGEREGKKKKETKIVQMLIPSHKHSFTPCPKCYSNDRIISVMTELRESNSDDPRCCN